MPRGNTPPGPGVDASGQAVIDPTRNVLDLVRMSNQRQDDLRIMEARHIREIIEIRNTHDIELRVAEARRIDAIRLVDQASVTRAAEVASEAVMTLAAQVPVTADAVRATLAAALHPIISDVQELRRVQYEQQGQRAATVEGRGMRTDSRTLLFAILGLIVSIAVLISPHIH